MNQNYILLTTRILDLHVFRRNRWDSSEYVLLKRAVRGDSRTSRLCVHLMHGVLRMHNMTVCIWKYRRYCGVAAVTVACIRTGSVAYLCADFLVEGQLRATQPCGC
jgi:hypothetical protein